MAESRRETGVLLVEELDSCDRSQVRSRGDALSVQSCGIHEADGKVKLIGLDGNARAELEAAYGH